MITKPSVVTNCNRLVRSLSRLFCEGERHLAHDDQPWQQAVPSFRHFLHAMRPNSCQTWQFFMFWWQQASKLQCLGGLWGTEAANTEAGWCADRRPSIPFNTPAITETQTSRHLDGCIYRCVNSDGCIVQEIHSLQPFFFWWSKVKNLAVKNLKWLHKY